MDEQIFNMFLKEDGYAFLSVWMLFTTTKESISFKNNEYASFTDGKPLYF